MFFFKKKDTTKRRQPNLMPGQENFTFRRSRTLTGTVSSKVSASAEQRSQLKTTRLKIHDLHQQRKQILRLLLGTLAICGALYFLLTSHVGTVVIDYPQASKGINKPDTAAYERTIKEYINERPLEQFSFSLDSANLTKYMGEKHAEVSSVYVERDNVGLNARFTVTLRQPLLVWNVPSGQFFVDDKGVAFTKNYFTNPLVQIVDRSGITPDSNTTIASKRFIRFLGQTVGAVNGGGKGRVVSVIIPVSTREIDLRLEGREYDIRTNIDHDPNQQAENIINALTFLDQKGIKPQYVDVRVAGKAYYRH